MTPEEAACGIARDHGLQVDAPTLLQDTNNIVIWLAPSPVVAKIGQGHHGRLEAELAFGIALGATTAPIVGPSPLLPQTVHGAHGYQVTFWQHVPQVRGELSSPSVAIALEVLHRALDRISTKETAGMRAFSQELEDVAECLGDRRFAPELRGPDRNLLIRALGECALGDGFREAVLHGSPHRYNILNVEGKPRFIDFETVCHGPVEWDLAHLEPDVANGYPGSVDQELLARCVTLVSAKTAAWCWARAGGNEEMRWHAQQHLDAVRHALR